MTLITPFYELEIYALTMAVSLWQDLLENSYTMSYIDHSAAQGALISGSSSTPTGRKLLQRIGHFPASHPLQALVCKSCESL